MHELSIAESLIDLVRQNTPADAAVDAVRVVAGPMRGIEPDAMQWAWQAATQGGELDGARLDLELLSWRLRCPQCGRAYTADDMFAACTCGCDYPEFSGGDELTLMSIEVRKAVQPCKCPS